MSETEPRSPRFSLRGGLGGTFFVPMFLTGREDARHVAGALVGEFREGPGRRRFGRASPTNAAAAEHQDAGVEPTNESEIDNGQAIAAIVAKTGIPRTRLYRHLPPRPVPALTAGDSAAAATDGPAEPTSESS
jgi:hypothetical protein